MAAYVGARPALLWQSPGGFMEIRAFIFCVALALVFAAASRPSHAAGCTDTKSKTDKQRINPLFERGELHRRDGFYIEVPLGHWLKMSDAQKRAFANSVVCAVFGPGGT